MLAFSTLAQIGEITAILGIGTALATDASLLHVTNHAVMKTLLFYAAGAFILQDGRAANRGPRRPRPRHALHRRRLTRWRASRSWACRRSRASSRSS